MYIRYLNNNSKWMKMLCCTCSMFICLGLDGINGNRYMHKFIIINFIFSIRIILLNMWILISVRWGSITFRSSSEPSSLYSMFANALMWNFTLRQKRRFYHRLERSSCENRKCIWKSLLFSTGNSASPNIAK